MLRRDSHLPALDGLRGVAILMVMWNHFTPALLTGVTSDVGRAMHRLANAGWAGVDLFFVLSGFLITGILLDAKNDRVSPGRYFGCFYARRTLRIFPLYYAVLVGVSIFAALSSDPAILIGWNDRCAWLWLYASNLVTAQNGWSFRFGDLLLNHFWSLAIEEQFYLIWPAVVFLCGRRSLRLGCFGAILLAPLLRYYFAGVEHNGYAAFALMPCRIDAFAVGALAAMASRQSPTAGRTGVILSVAAALLLPLSFSSDLAMDVAGRSLLAIGSGGLILLATHSRFSRCVDLPPLRFLGKYSYGLYVWHFLLYHALDRLFPLTTFGILGRFAGCVLASCAIAWCSWHLLERHFLKLKRFFPMTQTKPVVLRQETVTEPTLAIAV
jgi:peptidoglycan/LPS O-acetylase OafA/YrhL